MNLTTDPWIPIVWDDGKADRVSLADAFGCGHKIHDLAVRPHERIALMRLLICVAQAALDGPVDYKDWKTCRPRLVPAALDYLKRWQHAFELFGRDERFLQTKGKGNPGTMELDKLDFVDAEMTTLFDQDVVIGRRRDPAWIALHLVTYQSFAAGGTVGGSSEVGGKLQPQKGKNGPCRDSSAFHTFIRRNSLLSTIHSNLVTKEAIRQFRTLVWGRPAWEAKGLASLEEQDQLTKSFLGRLAPVSRAVWLNDDLATASNANGLTYPSFSDEGVRDSTTAVRVIRERGGSEKPVLLNAVDGDNIKKPWRELHALTVKQISDDGVGGPFALVNLNDDSSFDLWIGALVTDKAKVKDTVESTYSVPAGMLHATAQLAYEAGVKYAKHWEWRLRRAISIYRLAMETNEDAVDRLVGRLRRLQKPDRERLDNISNKMYSGFWTLIEHRLDLLNRFAAEPIPTRNGEPAHSDTDWGKHVCRVAVDSYDRACPHETARQIRAYALGRNVLVAAPDIYQPKKEETVS